MRLVTKPAERTAVICSVVAAAVVLLLIAGCDSGPRRVSVSGRVTFEGQPVELGRIRFYPLEGTEGPVSGARIENGEYQVPRGVPVGNHRVEIVSITIDPRYQAQFEKNPEAELPTINILPKRYSGQDSTLTKEVPYNGPVVLDFELTQ